MISNNSIELIIELAIKKASIIVLDGFSKKKIVRNKKSHQDIVTGSDTISQDVIKTVISNSLGKLGVAKEEICFISEEDTNLDKPRKYTFIIDPIDGTTNFAAGIRYFAISVAYAEFSKVKIGIVYDPVNQTMYKGILGKGSWVKYRNESQRKLSLKSAKSSKDWVVGCHYNGADVFHKQFARYEKLYPKVRGLRTLGCLILEICELAAGSIDLVLNGGTYIWDLAAAKLILEEAGGKVYNPSGKDLVLNFSDPRISYQLFACAKNNKTRAFSMLK